MSFNNVYCDSTPPASGNFNVAAYGPVVTKGSRERMIDAVGKGKVNDVIHRKFTFDVKENEDIIYGNAGSPGYVQSYSPAFYWADWNLSVLNGENSWDVNSRVSDPPGWTVLYPDDEVDRDCRIACLEKGRGLVADGLLNIVEGHQIYPSISSLAESLPKMMANWKDIRKVVKTASGAFLAWKFGVSPILGDIFSIIRGKDSLKRQLKAHMEGKAKAVSVSRPLYIHKSDLTWDISPLIERQRQCRVVKRGEVRYVLSVLPNNPYLSEFFRKADFVMSRFATSPARLAWETIPFSFVADWFVDIKGSLDTLDAMLGVQPFKVKGFSRSLSYTLATDQFVRLKSPCSGGELDAWRMCTSECQHYERSAVSTSIPAGLWKPRFGKSQAAITAALISQNLGKLR